ncbi:AAA family ATPase [Paraburkholderia sp. BCC1886]|uniref:AAA family ATPase n=1 Tax=Paraburkholderia sp. BCC1886 TaxID=2562670 RepID=UPI001182D9FF|nr:AAA family ATPase [Paraburkholderia sp. BCC1886]
MSADYDRIRHVGQRLCKELATQDAEGARLLKQAIGRKGVPLRAAGYSEALPVDNKSRLPLLEAHDTPDVPIFLDERGKSSFDAFLADATHFDKLVARGIASRLALMLSGPPGTGKTLLAGHIAAQLGRKLYVVRLDSVISSLLGDTAKNIRGIFDFVAGKNAVLFLDELDAIAKMRDDRNELGELKRVVNTVIQGIDSLEAGTIVIAATNHAQMLDTAIWRRFPYKIEFGEPERDLREALWFHFLGGNPADEVASRMLALLSAGLNGADIQELALAARRSAAHHDASVDMGSLACTLMRRYEGKNAAPDAYVADKRHLVETLVHRHGVSQAEVARFLGVSRQAISPYLKHAEDGH